MAIITISRGSFSFGKELAEKVAKRLGYEIVSREILLEASKTFNVPEVKLKNALVNPLSFLDKISYRREKYIAYIRAQILKTVKRDNIVYHGFAGHFFLKDVPHVFKIRVIANMEERIKVLATKENISMEEAKEKIKKLDESRKKWSLQLYGIDTNDPSLYDLVVHLDKIKVDDAVEMICDLVKKGLFNATLESKQMIEDMSICAELKTALMEIQPDVKVKCTNKEVTVIVSYPAEKDSSSFHQKLEKICMEHPEVKKVTIKLSSRRMHGMLY